MSDYGLDPRQVVTRIIRPTLNYLQLWSVPAEILVLGTALVESRLRYVDQIDKRGAPGPAFGLWQMEGPTHADHYRNFLRFNQDLKLKVIRLASSFSADFPEPTELMGNLSYACAMCRIHYRRVRESLPPFSDARAMAAYHKQYYNSALGKTRVEESVKHFEFAIQLEV